MDGGDQIQNLLKDTVFLKFDFSLGFRSFFSPVFFIIFCYEIKKVYYNHSFIIIHQLLVLA